MKVNKFIEIKEKIDLEEAIEFAWDITRRDGKAGYPEKLGNMMDLEKNL